MFFPAFKETPLENLTLNEALQNHGMKLVKVSSYKLAVFFDIQMGAALQHTSFAAQNTQNNVNYSSCIFLWVLLFLSFFLYQLVSQITCFTFYSPIVKHKA